MSEIDLRRLDLPLLLVFDELMRRRSMKKVAEHLGQTQSAISHSVARLRGVFGDDLFTRRPDGMEPTPRALNLQPKIGAILEMTRDALRPDAPFDPASATGNLRIAAHDYHCSLLAAPLIARCAREAPGLRPIFRPLRRREAMAALDASEIDLVLGYFPKLGAAFIAQPLLEQGYAVLVAKSHPRRRKLFTLDGYAAERHVLVSQSGDATGVVDGVLRQHGHVRSVVATVPYFMAVLSVVQQTDLIATVPERLAAAYAERFDLVALPAPVAIRRFTVSAARRARNHDDGLLDWATSAMRDAFSA